MHINVCNIRRLNGQSVAEKFIFGNKIPRLCTMLLTNNIDRIRT